MAETLNMTTKIRTNPHPYTFSLGLLPHQKNNNDFGTDRKVELGSSISTFKLLTITSRAQVQIRDCACGVIDRITNYGRVRLHSISHKYPLGNV